MTNENDFLVLELYKKSLRDDLKRALALITLEKQNVPNQRQYEIRKNKIYSDGHCDGVSFDYLTIKYTYRNIINLN